MFHRGQGAMIDFLLGAFVFLILFYFLTTSWVETRQILADEQALRETKQTAEQALDSLIRTNGYPTNWEIGNINDVNWIGIASQDRVIDETKINQLQSWASDWSGSQTNYQKVKQKMHIEPFEFFISLHDSPDVNLGWQNDLNATIVNLTRVVTYKGNVTKIEFKLYSRN